MSSSLRSAPKNWLIGKTIDRLPSVRLPRKLDVLRLVQFHHLDEKTPLPKSFKVSCEEVITIWDRARIPTQRVDSCVRKLSTLYDKYLLLKKNNKRKRETDRIKEGVFKGQLEELFDISTKNALLEMKVEEDREFLRKQRENVFSSSMGGVDKNTSAKETRKRKRQENEKRFKTRYEERAKECTKTKVELETSNSESQSEEEYQPPASLTTVTGSTASTISTTVTCKNIFNSLEVVGALDRVNLPDRGAVFVAGAVAKSLGHNLSDITLSRSSIRRARRKGREEAAKAVDESFSMGEPLVLHWDSKLLPDVQGHMKKVDRIAILVTRNGQEKLLGIPKMEVGTGESQATACVQTLQNWNLTSQIKALVFDTTATNTGLHKGACKRIEDALGSELVWIACRHHVLEITLSSVFETIFGSSEGPRTTLFERFKTKWSAIKKCSYVAGSEKLFQNPVYRKLRKDMLVYLPRALKAQQPRDDYQEFLTLSLIFLGGGSGNETIRSPGPTHHARWMAKGIYVLKIYLFRAQFKMTLEEEKHITDMALFLSLIYIKHWNEAPLGVRAPHNDMELLTVLQTYPNKTVAKSASSALCKHLRFFSEHLVGLAFFDDRVSSKTKKKMVMNLQRPKLSGSPRRLQLDVPLKVLDLKLENMVTKRTAFLFDVLIKGGKLSPNLS